MNGNDVVEYIENKNGAVEDAFIEKNKDAFMKFALEEMNNEEVYR